MSQRIKVTQINDHIWLLNDNDEATGYLVLGKEKGLVIDTMTGYEDVKAVVESLTDLPLEVVNTHGHPDHIYGNVYFGKAYIHPSDKELAIRYFQDPVFLEAAAKMGWDFTELAQNGQCPVEFLPIEEGYVFDLGDLEIEVYALPGHTPGGIVLLDRKDRILFGGDSILEQTWMQLEESLPMEQFLDGLRRIQSLRGEFDYLLTGHGRGLEDAEFCEVHIKAVEAVCNGEKDGDEPYTYSLGTCMAHPYGKEPRRIVYK